MHQATRFKVEASPNGVEHVLEGHRVPLRPNFHQTGRHTTTQVSQALIASQHSCEQVWTGNDRYTQNIKRNLHIETAYICIQHTHRTCSWKATFW